MRSNGIVSQDGSPAWYGARNPFDRMDHSLISPTMKLGVALRNRRKSLRLTQHELARLAGCGLAFLYELESGKATVRLDKLLGVLGVLGLELSLVEGRDALAIDAQWLKERP
jgi:HTH-type transcriptional regulator/antitoxin HipB